MLQIYRTDDHRIYPLNQIEQDSWVNLTAPTAQEIERVTQEMQVDVGMLTAALDEEERARIEIDDGHMLIIIDQPIIEEDKDGTLYATIPLGIILTQYSLITVCLKPNVLMEDFIQQRVKGFSTKKRMRFILQLLYRNSSRFLFYLKQIDKASTRIEQKLHVSMRNIELIEMLKLEKSLVFFSTSLKSNEVVLEKLLRVEDIKRYPDDTDLLEDVIVENKQAMEMCTIYRDILSNTMDAFASIISNNLNIVMKALTIITIIMAIPTLLFSLWGMNVGVPWEGNIIGFGYVIAISVAVTALAILWMKRKHLM